MSIHAMNADAAGFAGTVSSKLGDFTSRFGKDGRSAEYKDLQGSLDRMDTAVEEAIAKDEEDAKSFWNELKMVLRDGLDYPRKKQEFDTQVNGLVTATRLLKSILSSWVSKEGLPKLAVPDELKEVSGEWEQAHAAAVAAGEEIPGLKEIEGWGGDAYDQYQTMTSVQIEAVKEYQEFPAHMAKGYEQMGLLNAAVLGAIYDCVEIVVTESRKFHPAGANEFYVRTSAAANALKHSVGQLSNIMAMPEDAANGLQEALNSIQETPVVIAEDKWPHGTEQAGQQAANTRKTWADPNIPASPNVEGPDGSGSGINR